MVSTKRLSVLALIPHSTSTINNYP